MSERIALVTAIYDHYDTLKPYVPQKGVNLDPVCITDDPDLACDGWRVEYVPRAFDPNLAAKYPKARPWEFTGASASVWIDASFFVASETFVAMALAHADPIAAFVHPDRDCIYDEAAHSAGLTRYAHEPIMAQVAHYREQGHPEHWGLWANGVIARQHTTAVRSACTRWLDECVRWSVQDQLSLAPMLRLAGLRPTSLPGAVYANSYLRYEGSVRHA